MTYKNFTIHYFDELSSTNSEAMSQAGNRQIFDREIIVARKQAKGRGRMDRGWSSPEGNLYCSLVLQPKVLAAQVAQVSFVAIVALRQAVEELAAKKNIDIQNKWPNDLLIDGKKVAGLLLESKINQQNCEFVVLGIGVNINSNPDNTIFPAGNLSQFEIAIEPEILLQKFLDKFEILYQNWQDFGFANVRNAWLSKAYRLKEKILAREGEGEVEGIFEDMDSDGALILLVEGEAKKIAVADIYSTAESFRA